MHFDDEEPEDIERGVDDELVFESNDDDYWDEWNGLRQDCGQKMLRRTMRIHVRRHKVGRFVQWRLAAAQSAMARKAKSKLMLHSMQHVLTIAMQFMDRAMIKYFSMWREVALIGERSINERWDGVKEDTQTLIAHIHGLTTEKRETGDSYGAASWVRVVNSVANKRVRDKTSVFRSAVLKHREEIRRRDTSLQDQIKQLTLRNAVVEKELEDTKLIHTNVCKHNTQLKNDILAAIDERDTAMEDVTRAQRDAREAREEVRKLRDQLAGGSLKTTDGSDQIPITDDHLLNTNTNMPTPARLPSRSRFSAISAYSASIAGFDS